MKLGGGKLYSCTKNNFLFGNKTNNNNRVIRDMTIT